MGDKGPLLDDCAPLLSAHMARARLSDPLPFQVQLKVDALVRRYPACPGSRFAECRRQDAPRTHQPLPPRLFRHSDEDQPEPVSPRSDPDIFDAH